ncbi:cupin domain-containing protein [Dongia sp.]|uniref:cupin domain-containing protein n=1 Tax=Dongia sp. TaxID=1977262 RepID=UPI0035B2BDE6
MRRLISIVLLAMPALVAPALIASALADNAKPGITVTPIVTTDKTASGQPIILPQGHPELIGATYEIAPGAVLPEHKHPFPRYAYVLSGTLAVTNTDTGETVTYKPGDIVVEAVGQWHKGANIGTDPVKLVVIDLVEQGKGNVVKK